MFRRSFLSTALLTLPLSATRVRAAATPVVLELFTSQGCSSCPPADALLGDLIRQPGVIGLAWHVDYWNSLGWTDPYARRAWTNRQKAYAQRLGSEVFTPALVVNGATMLVGSDKASVRGAIDEATQPSLVVSLRRIETGLEAEIGPLPGPLTGLLVTYEPRVATEIGAGENQGHRLLEYHVVRDVVTLPALTPRLTLPAIREDQGAVLLIQDERWHVVGAAELVSAQRGDRSVSGSWRSPN
jgi:hypothetical protein